MFPKRDDGLVYLDEVCRVIWQHDKNGFRRIADENCCFRYFISQFEREDLLERSTR
jgi:hypothetical protein